MSAGGLTSCGRSPVAATTSGSVGQFGICGSTPPARYELRLRQPDPSQLAIPLCTPTSSASTKSPEHEHELTDHYFFCIKNRPTQGKENLKSDTKYSNRSKQQTGNRDTLFAQNTQTRNQSFEQPLPSRVVQSRRVLEQSQGALGTLLCSSCQVPRGRAAHKSSTGKP